MSIATTHYVTREVALEFIIQKLGVDVSNEQLGDMLDNLVHNGFYNFQVVSQSEFDANKNREYGTPYISHIKGFPEPNDAY